MELHEKKAAAIIRRLERIIELRKSLIADTTKPEIVESEKKRIEIESKLQELKKQAAQ